MSTWGRERCHINNLRLFMGGWAAERWWVGKRIGRGSEVRGVGVKEQRVRGSLGQSKSRNDIPFTVKHWEVTVWGGAFRLAIRLGFARN